MKNLKIHIPDSSMDEDDKIFQTLNYIRPRETSYAEAWRKIAERAGREPAFARRVRSWRYPRPPSHYLQDSANEER